MNWKLSSTVGALTLMTATTLSNVSPANAAALIGTFNIAATANFIGFDGDGDGEVDRIPGSVNGVFGPNAVPATDFDFFDLDNTSGPPDGGFVILPGNTGTFAQFNPLPFEFGTILDLSFADLANLPIDNFLTFSDLNPGNSFMLTGVGFSNYLDIDQDGDGVNDGSTVSLGFEGMFISANGEQSNARGTFSADFNELSRDVIADLLAGETLENVSLSAQFVATPKVPESSTTVGLVAFGLAGVVALARKRQELSVK